MPRKSFRFLLAFLLAPGPLGGCVTMVRPPANPQTPVEVFLIDYGRHSSLLFPTEASDGLVEFTYGDWNWYALAHDGLLDVFPTLFLPTQGTLGRLEWSISRDAETITRAIPCESVHPFTVEQQAAIKLRDRLESRFQARIGTRIESDLYWLFFVHDDRSYWIFSNCNSVMSEWLLELGCDVRGGSLEANFRFE